MQFLFIKVFIVLAASLFTEGVTELICKSLIFSKLRDKIAMLGSFWSQLINCGYCTSVWVAAISALFLPSITFLPFGDFLQTIISFIFYVVVIHRLSNFIHNFNDKHLDKYYEQDKNVR